jgi:hypothetical protein
VRIAIGRPSRVTTIAPSVATFDKTAPGLELNSLEAIICIVHQLNNKCTTSSGFFTTTADFSQVKPFTTSYVLSGPVIGYSQLVTVSQAGAAPAQIGGLVTPESRKRIASSNIFKYFRVPASHR